MHPTYVVVVAVVVDDYMLTFLLQPVSSAS